MEASKSRFSKVPSLPKDKFFNSQNLFKESTNPNKMNLTIGMLQESSGELVMHKCLEISQKKLAGLNLYKEYPPITGIPEFMKEIRRLFFEDESEVVKSERILVAHPVTGGAALRLCAEFVKKFLNNKIHLSNETFAFYKNLFCNQELYYYPYYNKEEKRLDIDSLLEYLEKIEDKSVINFQLSSHNPTGLDPCNKQWDQIAKVMSGKKHLALFDVAYLGYGTGSIEKDIYPIQVFANLKVEMLIAYSSGKNFTNYSDDVGALLFVLNNKEVIPRIKSHLVVISRSLFSFTSLYGSRMIEGILNDSDLKSFWKKEQYDIYLRIKNIRGLVINELSRINANINLNFLKSQKGIYMYLDLTDSQVEHLVEKYQIFVCSGGRINITGIKEDRIEYLANAIKETLENIN